MKRIIITALAALAITGIASVKDNTKAPADTNKGYTKGYTIGIKSHRISRGTAPN